MRQEFLFRECVDDPFEKLSDTFAQRIVVAKRWVLVHPASQIEHLILLHIG